MRDYIKRLEQRLMEDVRVAVPSSPASVAIWAILAFLLTAFALYLLGLGLDRSAPHRVSMDEFKQVAALLTSEATLAPEPQERFLFVTLTLLAPFLLGLALLGTERFARGYFHSPTRMSIAVEFTLALLGGLIASAPFFYCLLGRGEPLDMVFAVVVEQPLWGAGIFIACIRLAVSVVVGPKTRPPQRPFPSKGSVRRYLCRRWLSRTAWGTLLVLTLVFPAISFRLASLGSVSYGSPRWYSHFEALFYSVAQAANGKTLLADLPAQYGLYGELLAPWFKLLGLSVLSFTGTMVLLLLLGNTALFFTMRRLTRGAFAPTLWLFTMAQLSLWGLHFIDLKDWYLAEPYYQYMPVRFFFPALGVAAFAWFIRHPTPCRAATMGLLCGLAFIWNMDSGVAVTGAFFASVIAREALCLMRRTPRADLLAERSRRWMRLRQAFSGLLCTAGVGAVAMLLTLGVFIGWLLLKSGGRLHFEWLTQAQRVFYLAGVMMTPMPHLPHLWGVVVAAYLIGAAVGATAILRGGRSPLWSVLLYLAVLGMGLFAYYQGRSVGTNLLAVSWPAVMIAFLLTDQIMRAVRMRRMRSPWIILAAPGVMLGTTAAVCFLWDLPHSARFTATSLQHAFQRAATPIEANAAFIQAKIKPGETSAILTPHQAIYIAESGIASDLAGPGIAEMQLRADADAVVKQLLDSPVRHLFLGGSVNWPVAFGPDFHPWTNLLGPGFKEVFTRYRLEARGPSDTLLHYVPVEFAPQAATVATDAGSAHYVYDAREQAFRDAQGSRYPAFLFDPLTAGASLTLNVVLKPEGDQVPFAYVVGNRIDAEGFALLHAEREPDTYLFGPVSFQLPRGEFSRVEIAVVDRDVRVSVNGTLVAQGKLDSPLTPSALPLAVGNWYFGDRPFRGVISEVQINAAAKPLR